MLELRGLQKRYGNTVALDDCNFSVERGRVLGFLGRNGAGKTTAMRSIFGLVDLDGGEIRWDGRPVDQPARSRFGYMPEERGLYPRMAVDAQLEFFGQLRGLSAQEARRESSRWIERLELRNAQRNQIDQLSHGNQQKVQLAVALVGEPELLVLDEPFSGLDPIAVGILSSVIRDAAENGCAVVFSSHQLDLVGGVCDDVAIITDGHVVLSGDLATIRRNSPSRTLTVGLESAADPSWATRLSQGINGSLVDSQDGRARISVPAQTRPADILALLDDGLRVEELHLQPPELEEIFRMAVGEPA